MARSIADIKKSMTDQFMADSVIREKYGLSTNDTFDVKFSKVSLENIIFFIVAAAIFALESLFEQFRKDVDDRITTAVIASIPWYHRVCLEYQHGDDLVYDETTMEFRYSIVDESKQIIKYAAVKENASGVNVLVSRDDNGVPSALSTDVLASFKHYLNRRKPAGVLMNVRSLNPDTIRIGLSVKYNPLVMSPDGSLISDSAKYPVREAVKAYVAGIIFGGVFNKTKLVDAVQLAEGVEDVTIGVVSVKPVTRSSFATVTGNNATAVAGSFVVDNLENSINYVSEL